MSLSISTKYITGILIGTVLNLQIKTGRTDILTILSFLIHECGIFLQLIQFFYFFNQSFVVFFIQILSHEFQNYIFLKIIIIYFQRGGGRAKEKGRNINVWLPLMHPLLRTWLETQACALTGNGTSNPLVGRLALNPLSHTSQGRTQLLRFKNFTWSF